MLKYFKLGDLLLKIKGPITLFGGISKDRFLGAE